MVTEIYATGKTVNDAFEALKTKLGVDSLDEIEWKVVSAGKKGGLFGIGAQPAKVVAFIEAKDEPKPAQKPEPKSEPKPEPKPEAKPEQKPAQKSEQKPVQRSERTEKRPERSERSERPERKERPQQKPRVEKAPAAPEKKPEPKPKKPKTPTTESELKAAVSFVETLIENLEINVTATVDTDEDNASRITIAGDDAGMLVGHHGETLDALQYLANLAANRADGKDDHERITVDVEGYRARREEALRALARRQAEKVLKYGRSIMLEPMNPYERRIIHSEIQEIEGVSTNSIGSDSNRKVVIYLTANGMGRLPQRNDRRRGDARNEKTRPPRRNEGSRAEANEAPVETASAAETVAPAETTAPTENGAE